MKTGPRPAGRRLRALSALLAAIAGTAAWLVAPARAADTIYWTNFSGNSISFANLDGSGGGGTLTTTGATAPNQPAGLALDPAAGRLYWGNANGGKVSYANLDNTGGGGDLNTAGATTLGIFGLAIDPAGGRIYWANTVGSGAISRANLDNSGGANLSTTGATLANPSGIAIDPASNRIYWTNRNTTTGNKISAANLDGSGSGVDLTVSGGTLSGPFGIAVNPAAGKLYWSNQVISSDPQKLAFADLDGDNGANMAVANSCTGCAPASGVAFDPDANRIYWVNTFTTAVSYANLDGSGGGADLGTAGAPLNEPAFVAILRRPSPAAPPAVTGGSVTGSELSCSQGTWAPNVLGGHLYRAPRTFTYQWTLDGSPISGATGGSHTASAPGSYSCEVTAANAAGSGAPQLSSGHQVSSPPPPPPDVTTPDPKPKKCKKGRKLKKGKCVKKKRKKR
jgi:DNA-binding beta-propeller fold protein YncE